MFVPTLLCVTLAASSALPALAVKQYSRADLDDDMMFAVERRAETRPRPRPRPRPQTEGMPPHAIMRSDEGSEGLWAREYYEMERRTGGEKTHSRPRPRPQHEGMPPHAIMRSDEGSESLWAREYSEMERRTGGEKTHSRPRPRPQHEGMPPHAIMRRSYDSLWARTEGDERPARPQAPKHNQHYRPDLHHPQPIRPNPKWVGGKREDAGGLWEREFDDELWARMEVDELD